MLFASRRRFAGLFVLASLVLFSACSDDKKADPDPVQVVTAMSWSADGADVQANSTQKIISATDISFNGYAGSTASSTSVSLAMPAAVGTYALTDANRSTASATYVTETSAAGGTYYYATSGTITVTVFTPTSVEGTFSFSGTDTNTSAGGTKVVRNGRFNIVR